MAKSHSKEVFDLLVIGGGISGAGVARDAASRGMKCILFESRDFASGTSSRSSKLVHGGIRYLENLEFGLVFEALTERTRLFEMAPHMVHPLRFSLPIYKGGRVTMTLLGMGMALYDALSLFEAPELHERFNAADTAAKNPFLKSENLAGSYSYSDAYMDDDRLVLETLRSAESMGAVVHSYHEVRNPIWKDGKIIGANVYDLTSGTEKQIFAHHVVSTVGPWTDQVGNSFLPDWKNKMRPSKGVHLTFERSRLPMNEAVVMISDDEKRIVFAIPRHEMVIIGTTDTDFKDSPENVRTDKSDVDYLLEITKDYFPGANITRDDIVASYSGVRPLVHDGSDSESKTSREHVIINDPRGITFLTGGKYTTYRNMAEHTVDSLMHNFSLENRVQFGKSKTVKPLNPFCTSEYFQKTHSQMHHFAAVHGMHISNVINLVGRHGYEAFMMIERYEQEVLDLISDNEMNLNIRDAESDVVWLFEALHAMDHLYCSHLPDFFFRRTPLILTRRDHGRSLFQNIGKVFKKRLGWTEQKMQEELKNIAIAIHHEMAWTSE
jgi:glycerol-3-phosphate dehydrogenase